ncbi:hypothetical protein ACHAPU_000126 [Fusarium lateritium]
MSCPTILEQDESQSWEFVEISTATLPIRTKKPPSRYSIEIEGEEFFFEEKHIAQHPEFAVHFDEERQFKHNKLSAATKNIITSYLLYGEVLEAMHADDAKDTPGLHFLALVIFRDDMQAIDLPDIKRMAYTELARLAGDLPFHEILRVLLEEPMLQSINLDNTLLMLLSSRLHPYAPPLQKDTAVRALSTWAKSDLDPGRMVLRNMIDLRLQLQLHRDTVGILFAKTQECSQSGFR